MSRTATRFALVWLFSFGCASTPSGTGETSESSSTSTASDSGSSSTSTDDTGGEESDGTSEESSTGPTPDFLLPECDILAQNCDDGEKCVPDGDRTVCVPIDDNPQPSGGPCNLDRPADDCDAGLICWPPDTGGTEGTCVPLCKGDFEAPTCDDAQLHCAAYRREGAWFPLCRPVCDPTDFDCGPAAVCELSSYKTAFVCSPPGLPLTGEHGDKCDLDGAPDPLCDAGLHCEVGQFGCGDGCCFVLCDLDMPVCDVGECMPRLDDVEGLESIGVCKIG